MELLQLKYFCDAARSQNFTKTAEKYEVPPSNISQSIRRLEKELGAALFTRCANSVSLNEKGKRFYDRVSQALGILDSAVAEASDDGERGRINICVNTNRRIVMTAVEKFQKLYPRVTIKAKFFCDPLSEGFDIVVSDFDARLNSFKSQELLSEQLAVAINKHSDLSGVQDFNVSMLESQPFISLNESSSLYKLTIQVCAKHGFLPNIVVQSDDPFYVRKCVDLGLGVAVVPMFSWKGQFSDSVVLKSIDGLTRQSFIYTAVDRYQPECVNKFTKLLISECNEEGGN
jgi:LysR family transcriptional activator of glutamate synthase operon